MTQCKDCIYGDCHNGINRSCSEWPAIGKVYIVDDIFFCDKGLSREEAKRRLEDLESEVTT